MDTMPGGGKQRGRPSASLRLAGIHITVIPVQATAVIPANAGIHVTQPNMDSRFRGNDGSRVRGDDGSRLRADDELCEWRVDSDLSRPRAQKCAYGEDDAEGTRDSERVQRPDEEEGAGGALDAHTRS